MQSTYSPQVYMFSLVCEYVICFGSVLLEKRYNFVSSKLPYYYQRTLDCDLKNYINILFYHTCTLLTFPEADYGV